MAAWRWKEVLDVVTGRPTNDNIVHLRRNRTETDVLNELDAAKEKLIDHVNAILPLRDAVRELQLELAAMLRSGDTGREFSVMHLPEINLETLTMSDGGQTHVDESAE